MKFKFDSKFKIQNSKFSLWSFSKFFLIFILILTWLFSGFPRIWENPPAPLDKYLTGRFPPEIQEAKAVTCGFGTDIGGGQCRGFITTTGTSTWPVPSDWSNNNEIEVIGGGGGAGTSPSDATGGGGGGAYASTTISGLSPGASIDCSVGAGGDPGVDGGDTWFNGTTCLGSSVCAGGGKTSPTLDEAGGAGGTVQVGTGFSGGNGGNGGTAADDGGGGGGGAAGPGGAGKNGGSGGIDGLDGGGGGGGAGGGLSTAGSNNVGDVGGTGGNGPNGTGGGLSGGGAGSNGGGGGGGTDVTSEPGGAGGAGTEWDATHGAGGGGGGGADAGAGANGGLYGGGGGGTGEDGSVNGSGAQGIIVITYTPANITVGTGGSQVANMNVNSTNNYVGGYFTFIRDYGTADVTQIIITDTGTVNANLNLSNVDIYYETAASCVYDATETLFGTATSFDTSEKATATGTMSVGTSQVCVYVVLDVGSGAAANETIEIEISNPSTEVTASNGTVSPSTAVAIAGTTTLQEAANQTPTVSNVSLNAGNNITLIENTTQAVTATATVSDGDGYSDISSVIGRIYRSSLGENCTLDNNNCYEDTSCATSSCAGNDCIATCDFSVYFHAEPTDASSPWSAEYWTAWIKAIDSQNASSSATNTAQTIEMNTLLALDVTSNISYGTMLPGETIDPLNVLAVATTTGNAAIDANISGTQMCTDYPTCAGNTIATSSQHYATSSVAYASGYTLQSAATLLEFDTGKPTASPSNQAQNTYWGIAIPSGQAVGTYNGRNTFDAQTD